MDLMISASAVTFAILSVNNSDIAVGITIPVSNISIIGVVLMDSSYR